MKMRLSILLFCLYSICSAQTPDLKFLGWYNLRSYITEFQTPVLVEDRFYSTIQLFEPGFNFPRNYVVEFNGNGIVNRHEYIKRDNQGDKIDFLRIGSKDGQLVGYYETESGEKSILYQVPMNPKTLAFQKGKEKILDGDRNKNKPSPILGDLNGKRAMENKYFGDRHYGFVEFPNAKKTLVLKREPDKMADEPVLKFVLLGPNEENLSEGRFKLKGSNRHTEIVDIDIDDQNNIYFLTRTKDGSAMDYRLTVFDDKEKDDRTLTIQDDRYIHELQLSALNGKVMAAGFASDKRGARRWDLILTPINVSEKRFPKFKTLEQETYDQDDVIDIKSVGSTFMVIAKSFRAANYEARSTQRQIQSSRFSPRETRSTVVYGIDQSGEQKWLHVIPNYISAEIYTYKSFEEGYQSVLFDNYLYLENKNNMVVIYPMNPLNDRKPKKNGKARSVVLRSKKKFALKAVTFSEDGVQSEKIFLEGQNAITPIPYFTKEVAPGKYFMLGTRYRGGVFSIGTLSL